MVPADNCADALDADNGDMRLVRATSFEQALTLDRGVGQGPRRQAAQLQGRVVTRAGRPEEPELDDPLGFLDADPALASAVLEIEAHIAEAGWDQPARLYALVNTADLVRQEPDLARAMGLDKASADGSLTPVEQEQLPAGGLLEDALGLITWPPSVAGCAAVVERLVLPPDVEDDLPDDVGGRGRVRARAPRPPGGPDRRGRHAGRIDVLRHAPAGP